MKTVFERTPTLKDCVTHYCPGCGHGIVSVAPAAAVEGVQVAGTGQLDGLEGHLGRRAPDHQSQVVRRAGRRAEKTKLLVEESAKTGWGQDGLGFLEQIPGPS